MTPPTPPTTDNGGQDVDLLRFVAVLRRRAPLIAACLLLSAAAAFVFAQQQTKEYTASASLVFNTNQASQVVAGLQPVPGTESPVQQSTRATLLQLGPTAKRTAAKIGNGLSAAGVKRSISIEPQGESNVIAVTATATSPKLAARIANTYARQFVARQLTANQDDFASARNLVEKQFRALPSLEQETPQGLALLERAQSLSILAKLKQGEVQIAQAAIAPSSPSSPKVARSTVLGAVLGLLLGLGLAFLLERLNRQLREPEEARDAFGLPVLSVVPESKSIRVSNEGTAATELPFAENEAFRMLRASLRYFNVDDNMRSVLVTSQTANVGKSTIAWNLARVAATSSKTILVEADLRNPTIANQHGLAQGPGLGEVLTRQVGLDIAIQSKPIVAGGANGANGSWPALDAITAGAVPPNPAELLESQAMAELLSLLTERYELIVLDTPPVGVVSDCFPLLRKVDGVIGIARMGESTRDAVGSLREQLDWLEAPVLGIVANGYRQSRRRYGYGYGHYGSYDNVPAEQPGPAASTPGTAEPQYQDR